VAALTAAAAQSIRRRSGIGRSGSPRFEPRPGFIVSLCHSRRFEFVGSGLRAGRLPADGVV
jgi:hypothetical protein